MKIMVVTKQRGITAILLLISLMVLYNLVVNSEHYRRKLSVPVTINHSSKTNQGKKDLKKQNEESHKEVDTEDAEPRNKLILRKPDENLLKKLSKKDKDIESVTEPLPLSPTCTAAIFLAILVISAPKNFEERNAIRGGWASTYHRHNHAKAERLAFPGKKFEGSNVVKTVFVIGRDSNEETRDLVKAEARTFGDIVLGSFDESYRNLTMKTRLGLKWAYYHCRVDFLLKTDDDVFINPVPLVEWLKQVQHRKLYTGWCNFGSPVIRDKGNKWYVSEEDYSGTHYPGYCLGGGYLMSEDVLDRVMKKSYGRKLFPMEDLYVGIMVSEFGDIQPRDEKFHFDLVFDGRKACETRSLFLAHQVAPRDQLLWLMKYEKEEISCK